MYISMRISEYVHYHMLMAYSKDVGLGVSALAVMLKDKEDSNLVDDILEYLSLEATVDYPAGREAGHSIHFSTEVEDELKKLIEKNRLIAEELDKYIRKEKTL